MSSNQSLWLYFVDASLVVKTVMILLFATSVLSWTFIIQRGWFLKKTKEELQTFEDQFWSGNELSELYERMNRGNSGGIGSIFHAGFKEFLRVRQNRMLESPE